MAMLAICSRSLKRLLSKHEQRKQSWNASAQRGALYKLTMLTGYNLKVVLLLLFIVCINLVY